MPTQPGLLRTQRCDLQWLSGPARWDSHHQAEQEGVWQQGNGAQQMLPGWGGFSAGSLSYPEATLVELICPFWASRWAHGLRAWEEELLFCPCLHGQGPL